MWRLLAFVVVAACHREQAPAGNDTSEQAYARKLIEALDRGGEQSLAYDATRHEIAGAGGLKIATTNLYQEWLKLPPAERDGEVARIAKTYAASKAAAELPLDSARALLLPIVHPPLYFTTAVTTAPHAPIGSATAVGLGIDQPDMIRIVTKNDLERWHATLDELLPIAIANLRNRGVPFRKLDKGAWESPARDNYDASRLLLVDEVRALELSGGAVALIANRDSLLLAGAHDADALLAIADRAEREANEPRPNHTIALCLNGDTWSDCIPDVTPAVRDRYRDLATAGWAQLYGDQQQALQDQLGENVYVAKLEIVQDKATKHLTTYATWTHTVPTMLPRADYVAFVETDRERKAKVLGLVPWDRVMAICGAHLHSDGRSPERWATGDWFPSTAELAELGPTMKFLPR